jgi:hypothetical protein
VKGNGKLLFLRIESRLSFLVDLIVGDQKAQTARRLTFPTSAVSSVRAPW